MTKEQKLREDILDLALSISEKHKKYDLLDDNNAALSIEILMALSGAYSAATNSFCKPDVYIDGEPISGITRATKQKARKRQRGNKQ